MIKEDIEIGIKITPSIYLNIREDLGNVPFDVDHIIKVEATENGSTVYVAEPEGPVSSRIVVNEYFVTNSCDKIKEAIGYFAGQSIYVIIMIILHIAFFYGTYKLYVIIDNYIRKLNNKIKALNKVK